MKMSDEPNVVECLKKAIDMVEEMYPLHVPSPWEQWFKQSKNAILNEERNFTQKLVEVNTHSSLDEK